jgi:hypothetical protein
MPIHQNDIPVLKDMLRLKGNQPLPPSMEEIYDRARWLMNGGIGTGSLRPELLVMICLHVQDIEKAAGRPVPGLPERVETPLPQHQWAPKSNTPEAAEEPAPEKNKGGRPRKDQPVVA